MHAAEFLLLSVGEFGLLASQFSLGAGDGHALAGAQATEIGFELGEGGEDVEEHLSHGIARVVERGSQGQFHASFLKLVSDGEGIRDGPGQAVEFGHDQGVAFSQGGEGLIEAGTGMTATLIGYARCSTDRQERELCRMHATGEYSISDLAELFSVSRPTLYRTLNRHLAS